MGEKEFVSLFGRETLLTLDTLVQKAYSLGELFFMNNELFSTPSAENLKQHIINLSVDYQLERACKKQQLNLLYAYKNNQAHNCKHIELYNEDFVLTHSSCNSASKRLPRDAIFRKELACTNQMNFFYEDMQVPKYGIIIHRNWKTNDKNAYVILGIPDSDYGKLCDDFSLTNYNDSKIPISKVEQEYDDFEFELKKNLKIKQIVE